LSKDKKDLTRIEDLGEFIHELNGDEEEQSSEDFPSEVPDFPESPEEDPFTSNFESNDQKFAFEPSAEFESNDDFGSTDNFSSNDFNSTDLSSTDIINPEAEDFKASDFETGFDSEIELVNEQEDDDEKKVDSSTEEMSDWNFESKEDSAFSSEPEIESKPDPEIYQAPTPQKEYKTPETFEDLRKFSESSSFTGMATEGNPSFSVLIKNVRFIEDVNDIVILLRELTLMVDSEEQTKTRLMRGMLLIPRISEYAAIFLAHKLRRFDIDIQVGLSDEIHPPKHQETPETGIVSKFNLYQNQSHHFQFDDAKLELGQIIVASTSSLDGYQVLRYLGVASEHKMLDSDIVEDENSEEVPRHYHELAQKLKAHALKSHANAVLGLNYQLTPIPSEFGMSGHKYRLTCTGNLVWVNKV
jgi:uncharacterized protein YbjQ (UPF0145 family)